jgi:hypothetical protein
MLWKVVVEIVCMNNLKQIGTVQMFYVEDFNDYLLPAAPNQGVWAWTASHLYPSFFVTSDPKLSPPPVVQCPSGPKLKGGIGHTPDTWGEWTSYSFNNGVVGTGYKGLNVDTISPQPWVKMSEIKNPSTRIVTVDSSNFYMIHTIAKRMATEQGGDVARRHNMSANWLLLDFHVQTVDIRIPHRHSRVWGDGEVWAGAQYEFSWDEE